jgi:2-polyprenyl-3-methyl-5-hydroxy-6-metoxy-1,4-benzoquinol methylase
MLKFVPSSAVRFLDVGCGQGVFGSALKGTRPHAEVWGIEPSRDACEEAGKRLDKVWECTFSDALPKLPRAYFGLICFNDVLEHMIEPEIALRESIALLEPGGAVLASIPNFRYFPNLWEILWKEEFEYKTSGILDSTHLRFFTRKSMVRMFDNAGYKVETVEGIGAMTSWRLSLLQRLMGPLLRESQYQAYAVIGRVAVGP